MSMRILQVNYGDFGMRPKHGPKQGKTEMRKICIRRVLTLPPFQGAFNFRFPNRRDSLTRWNAGVGGLSRQLQ